MQWSGDDRARFVAGVHDGLWHTFGAHVSADGVRFRVWAPSASAVSVTGDFDGWDPRRHPLQRTAYEGIWDGTVAEALPGQLYQFCLTTTDGRVLHKADPMAFWSEEAPGRASRIWQSRFEWDDQEWMERRRNWDAVSNPVSVYEVHPGSWRPRLDWSSLGEQLADYAHDMGFTHVELMPVMEHPFYGSWGYQSLGYFSPNSRHGDPDRLKALINRLHRRGLGVILDWVPAHFPDDAHGLSAFDGEPLYEHHDPKRSRHPHWNSLVFNFESGPVRSFLGSSARFWLEEYHVDGLRVDAVASAIYRDYGRPPDDFVPNAEGGVEEWSAVEFFQQMNQTIRSGFPGVMTIAEESTLWPGVTRVGGKRGLGFTFKWDLGWMHDTLEYFETDPLYKGLIQDRLLRHRQYRYQERFMLPLSHDEVVYGKHSLANRFGGPMPERLAGLRVLLGYQFLSAGKKLLFMGGEWGQSQEWSHDDGLHWGERAEHLHSGVAQFVRDLNHFYRSRPWLGATDHGSQRMMDASWHWILADDHETGVMAFIREPGAELGGLPLLVVFNATPVVRRGYRIGVPVAGAWLEVLNSDSRHYGGHDEGNYGQPQAVQEAWHGYAQALVLTLPALSLLVMEPDCHR